MGRPTTPKATPKAEPTPDPLADLREDDDTPGPEAVETTGTATIDVDPAVLTVRPMVDQATQDEMVAEAVAAFHADPTSQGFLHGGGQCGCRYIARQAIQAAVPVMTEEDQAEKELTPSE